MPAADTHCVLDDSQLSDFERDGFLHIPHFYGAGEISRASSYIEELMSDAGKGKGMRQYENSLLVKRKKILSRIEHFADFHEGLRSMVYDEYLFSCVSQLLREPAVLFKEKVILKLPGGGGFVPHQDQSSDWDTYATFFITATIAIDDSTVENGCLEFAPSHHNRGLIGRRESWNASDFAGIEFEKYPMKAGDIMFFGSFAPHQSGPNLTPHPRRTFYFSFNRSSEGDHRNRYFAGRQKNLRLLKWLPFLFGSWRVTDRAGN